MSNLFVEAQESHYYSEFQHNLLQGLNRRGRTSSKINVVGNIDTFTLKTIHSNYECIAENLKVYPTVTIYPRNYKLEGGFGGFYYADKNHIKIVDHFYIISMLAHEMRHAYQYIYFPDMYFNTSYQSVSGYLNCNVERDARAYAQDYCTIKEYWEEAKYCAQTERDFELVIQYKKLATEVGSDEQYFKHKPQKAWLVPRTYHLQQEKVAYLNKEYKQIKLRRFNNEKSRTLGEYVRGVVVAIVIVMCIMYWIGNLR